MLPVQEDPIGKGKGRLLQQFSNKPNINGTLTTYLRQVNDLELMWFELLNERADLATISGKQLDVIGGIVGENREGRGDDSYRLAIYFRIGINNSKTTPEYLSDLCKQVTESTITRYFEYYPAAYSIEFNGTNIPNNFLQGFIDASPSTVNLTLISNPTNKGLTFSEDGDLSPTSDDGIVPEDGDGTGHYVADGYSREISPLAPVVPPTPDPKDFLKTVFNVTTKAGTGGTLQTVNNGLDLTSSPSAVLAWSPTLGVYSSMQIDGFSTDGYKSWFQLSDIVSNLSLTKNATGFTLSTPTSSQQEFDWNLSGHQWHYITMLKAVGFCDIVPYTGDGNISQAIPHSLGKVPAFVCCSRNTSGSDTYRFRDMPYNKAFSQNSTITSAAVWGGQIPTDAYVTVGDIGGNNSPNTLGVDYLMIVFADNPEGAAITAGSYQGNGVAGTEVDIGNNVGLLFIKGFSNNAGVLYCSDGKLIGKSTTNGLKPTSLQVVNKNGTNIVLSDDLDVNSNGQDYYWFNIANPNT